MASALEKIKKTRCRVFVEVVTTSTIKMHNSQQYLPYIRGIIFSDTKYKIINQFLIEIKCVVK